LPDWAPSPAKALRVGRVQRGYRIHVPHIVEKLDVRGDSYSIDSWRNNVRLLIPASTRRELFGGEACLVHKSGRVSKIHRHARYKGEKEYKSKNALVLDLIIKSNLAVSYLTTFGRRSFDVDCAKHPI